MTRATRTSTAPSNAGTISSVAAAWVIECARRRGANVSELFELSGLDPKAPPDPDRHLPASRYVALWERAAQRCGPDLPLEAGATFDVDSLGVFGFLAISCDTLGDAQARTAAVRALYNVGASWELERHRRVLRLVWNPWPLRSPALAIVSTYQVAEMLTATRRLTHARLVPRRVAFRHSRPADTTAHRKVFGLEPDFDADFDGLEADASWLELPIRTANPRLRAYFEKQCAAVQAEFAQDPPFAAQVRRQLSATMNGSHASMKEVATALSVTERTLHRKLAQEGTGYATLLDEVRHEFAERYLARKNLALAEIGFLLGFDDSSSFFRAFRRWTGTTPGRWRATRGG